MRTEREDVGEGLRMAGRRYHPPIGPRIGEILREAAAESASGNRIGARGRGADRALKPRFAAGHEALCKGHAANGEPLQLETSGGCELLSLDLFITKLHPRTRGMHQS